MVILYHCFSSRIFIFQTLEPHLLFTSFIRSSRQTLFSNTVLMSKPLRAILILLLYSSVPSHLLFVVALHFFIFACLSCITHSLFSCIFQGKNKSMLFPKLVFTENFYWLSKNKVVMFLFICTYQKNFIKFHLTTSHY